MGKMREKKRVTRNYSGREKRDVPTYTAQSELCSHLTVINMFFCIKQQTNKHTNKEYFVKFLSCGIWGRC